MLTEHDIRTKAIALLCLKPTLELERICFTSRGTPINWMFFGTLAIITVSSRRSTRFRVPPAVLKGTGFLDSFFQVENRSPGLGPVATWNTYPGFPATKNGPRLQKHLVHHSKEEKYLVCHVIV